jgi:hypothetical protein
MAAMNKQLHISESHDDSNRCTPYRGKSDQYDMYASHASPRTSGVRFLQTVPIRGNLSRVVNRVGRILLILRKSVPDSTSQPGWVAHETHLNFSSNTAIGSVGLSQASINSRLLGLPHPYQQHVIGTFNTCSWIPTPQSLTDTGGTYHIGNLKIATTLSPSFPFEGSTDPPNDPLGLRLSIQYLSIELERKQALNLASGSLHSTSTVTYHLSIALLTVSHHKMG